jgi:hypothetical protein
LAVTCGKVAWVEGSSRLFTGSGSIRLT